jgi:AraC-type DNA-binding domain-containing proteins
MVNHAVIIRIYLKTMRQQHIFDSSLKTIGLLYVNNETIDDINGETYKSYIKVLYLPEGYKITVDFAAYATHQPTLFFVGPNQFLQIEQLGAQPGYLVFYNRDFYCIQIHDQEVACDGLLFNNINNMPQVDIPAGADVFITLLRQMEEEFQLNDPGLEEMVRTYLKQLLIKATRLWKQQHLEKSMAKQHSDVEFFRKFTRLVDAEYKTKHTVADYAELLLMSPKTITHKFKRLKLPQPNEVIKNRIVLEAKRLLIHTSLSAKEIAHDLGYDDPAYFSRLFQVKTGHSPSAFRLKYHAPSES